MSNLIRESIISVDIAGSAVQTHHVNHETAVDKENKIFIDTREQYIADEAAINTGYCNGRENTQHGVNAEHIHVAEFNINETRQAAEENRDPIYMRKSEDVNGPHDMVRGDEIYQSKYCSENNITIDHCISHAGKYAKDYINNPNAFYTIPKDQYDNSIIVKNGGIPEGWSARRAENLKNKIEKVEEIFDCPFEEKFKPGAATYDESFHRNNPQGNKQRRERIEKEHEEAASKIADEFTPKFKDTLITGAKAGATAGAVAGVSNVIRNGINGKNIFAGDYTSEDYDKLLDEIIISAAWAGGAGMVMDYLGRNFKESVPYVNTGLSTGMLIFPHASNYFNGKVSQAEALDGIFESLFVRAGIKSFKNFFGGGLGRVLPAAGPLGFAGNVIATIAAEETLNIIDGALNDEIRAKTAACDKFVTNTIDSINTKIKDSDVVYNDIHDKRSVHDNPNAAIDEKIASLHALTSICDGFKPRLEKYDTDKVKAMIFGNK